MVVLKAAGIAVLFLGCAGSGASPVGPRPVALLSSRDGAADALEVIRLECEAPEPAWATIKENLGDFIQRYRGDALVSLAKFYLANALIELGDLQGAGRAIGEVGVLPVSGSLTDLGTVIRARLHRVQGRPELALPALRALSGKLIDSFARDLLEEELVLTAVALHRDDEAISHIDIWLRSTTEDRLDAVLGRIDAALSAIGPESIERSIRAMRAQSAQTYSPALLSKMALKLSADVLKVGDARRAAWLIDASRGPALIAGVDAIALKELASRRRGKARVRGRAIGLVLPIGSPALRDASADVARGAAFALGLPRSVGQIDDGTRLLTRTTSGGDTVESALDELASEGAAVVVAGLDGLDSERAIRWGESYGVTVIVLDRPSTAASARFGYAVGEDATRTIAPLISALAALKHSVGVLLAGSIESSGMAQVAGDAPWLLASLSCDPPVSMAGFDTAQWARARVTTVLVSGSAACARAVQGVVPSGAALALGPNAASALSGSGRSLTTFSFAAGAFPEGAPGARVDPDMRRYRSVFGESPSWWTALGYDAATLARAAVSGLPLDDVEVDAQLTHRRQSARGALGSATATLWTTEARGFARGHLLDRAVRVVELARGR